MLTIGTTEPNVLCEALGSAGLDWIDDDTVVFVHRNAIHKVSRMGGASSPVAEPPSSGEGRAYRYPEATPDGRVLLFTAEHQARRSIVARSLATGEEKVVSEDATFPRYLASGHLVFLVGGRTVAAPFDLSSLQLTGAPVPIDEGIVERLQGGANFDVSPEGTFVSMTGSSMPYVSRFAWFNRDGVLLSRIGDEDLQYPRYPRLSPDGRRFVGTVGPGIRGQLWTFDVAGAAQPVKLTSADHNVCRRCSTW